jgi:putative membrane protein
MMIKSALVGFVALEHAGFLVLEMFFWRKPLGLKVFAQTQAAADASAVLAANQGLYNGFLAAGLIWGLTLGDARIQTFFLCCAAVAGLFGGLTASRGILVVQLLPAAVALIALRL